MFSFFVCYCLTRKVYYNSIVKIRKSTKSHVSASLKDLEKKGLVERIQSADNKKHIEINLLSKAEPIVEAGLKAQKQFAKNVLSGLSEEEKTVCISVFQKIYNQIVATMPEKMQHSLPVRHNIAIRDLRSANVPFSGFGIFVFSFLSYNYFPTLS